MQIIYIVEEGEDCEGGSVVSVNATIAGARTAAKKFRKEHAYRDWARNGKDRWHAGCDWLKITEHVVQQ